MMVKDLNSKCLSLSPLSVRSSAPKRQTVGSDPAMVPPAPLKEGGVGFFLAVLGGVGNALCWIRSCLQRLFSTFSNGWPGIGILLQRVLTATILVSYGIAYLRDTSQFCINSSGHVRSSRRDTTPGWLMDADRWNDDHDR